MQHLLLCMAVVANLYSLFWLTTYQRDGSRFKMVISMAAYGLIIAIGGKLIDFSIAQNSVTYADGLMSIVIAALVHRARGNVALVFGE